MLTGCTDDRDLRGGELNECVGTLFTNIKLIKMTFIKNVQFYLQFLVPQYSIVKEKTNSFGN